jgi:hypothetical protein
MRIVVLCLLPLLLVSACTTLTLKPVDFAWPVESVLKANDKGMVEEERYMISFSIKPLMFDETKDSTKVQNVEIRMIRDMQGYYYVISKGFKNVYVFAPGEGSLKLEKKIMVSEKGLDSPAFNQRTPYIQLLNGKEKPRRLTRDGLLEEGKS